MVTTEDSNWQVSWTVDDKTCSRVVSLADKMEPMSKMEGEHFVQLLQQVECDTAML